MVYGTDQRDVLAPVSRCLTNGSLPLWRSGVDRAESGVRRTLVHEYESLGYDALYILLKSASSLLISLSEAAIDLL
jgi:hypothetical protein